MANFNLVVDTSSFKPFSYDEMIRPLLLYKQEEEARQQAYLDLQERASTLEDLAASEKDIEAYNTYNTYKNRLKEIADDMARNGLTRQNSQVFNLRKQYINDIKPLNDLLKKRNDLIREQRERDKGDGTNIYSIDYSNMSLSDMQKNPAHTYNTLNGNAVRAISAEVFEKLADQIMKSPERSSILGGQYFEEKIQRGYTLDQIIEELQGTKTGSKLFETKQKILSSLNMDKKGFSSDDQKRIAKFVDMGAMAALGRTEYNRIENQNFIDPIESEQIKNYQQSRAINAAQEARERAKYNFTYKQDEKGNIIGVNGDKKVKMPASIPIGDHNYYMRIQGNRKVIIRINNDGSETIMPADSGIAKKARKMITDDENIIVSAGDLSTLLLNGASSNEEGSNITNNEDQVAYE